MSTTPPRSVARTSDTTSIITSSAYVGGSAAVTGGAFSAAYATLKGRPAVLWTAAAGAQCFVLGSTFWFTRSLLRHNAAQARPLTYREDLAYSSLAGTFAGLTGGALRGRGNILPGAIVLGLVGLGGQLGMTAFAANADAPAREKRPLLDRLSDSKWWPLKSLSDEDYECELQEKLVGLEAEMQMIDEKISTLRHQKATSSGQS